MMALIVPVRCYVAIYVIRRFVRPPATRAALSAGIVLAGMILLLVKADWTGPFRYVDERRDATWIGWTVNVYMGTLLMNRTLPEGSIVGSWDAGTLGYFSRFPVVNLDGLVNSYDYLRAQAKDEERYRKFAYRPRHHEEFGLTHLANLATGKFDNTNTLFTGILDKREVNQWFRIASVKTTNGPAHAGAWFFEAMAPHFHHQQGGVAHLVDGRLSQAFAQSCTQDELAVWSWAGQQAEMTARPWTNTETGLCAGALMLPHNTPPPERVDKMTAQEYLTGPVFDRTPEISSDFAVYRIANRLIYARKQCRPADTDAAFFLHLYPVDRNDLPDHCRQYGFDSRDFNFDYYGRNYSGVCLAEVPLPEYGIAAIRTGQYVTIDTGSYRVWEGEIRTD